MLVISGIKTVCSLTRKGVGRKKGKNGAIQSFGITLYFRGRATRRTEFCTVSNILVNAEVSQLILTENLFKDLTSRNRKF